MSTAINLKKRKWIGKREVIVMVAAVAITAAGIKASDSVFNSADKTGANSDGCPAEMVFVPSSEGGFCVDRYEASPGGSCPRSDPASQAESRNNLDYRECRPVSEAGKMPWRFISQNQAGIACAKAGKRLPTNKEWQAAALGTPDPDGRWGAADCQVDNNWNRQPGAAGSGANCVSAAGAYDMIGNVWEWIEGTVEEGGYHGKALPEAGYILAVDDDAMPSATDSRSGDENYYNDYFWVKSTESRGIARGGYHANKSEAGQYAVYAVSQPSFAGAGVGFRCVK